MTIGIYAIMSLKKKETHDRLLQIQDPSTCFPRQSQPTPLPCFLTPFDRTVQNGVDASRVIFVRSKPQTDTRISQPKCPRRWYHEPHPLPRAITLIPEFIHR
jgi:hypothetical protein